MPKRKKKEEKNVKISGTIKPEQHSWVEKKINEGIYYNISHILQEGIKQLQIKEENKN